MFRTGETASAELESEGGIFLACRVLIANVTASGILNHGTTTF